MDISSTVMPSNLVNSPRTFSHIEKCTFGDIKDSLRVYLDDILIDSNAHEEMMPMFVKSCRCEKISMLN